MAAEKKATGRKQGSSPAIKSASPASKKKPVQQEAVGMKKTVAGHTGKTVLPSSKGPMTVKRSDERKEVSRKPAAASITDPAPVAGRLAELRKMLLAKREEMLKEAKQEIVKYVSGENRQLVDAAVDEADLATVDISEDINIRRLATHRQLLLDIDECLRKMKEGTYGICEDCGEEISARRLSVLPTAVLCIDCQENKEKFHAFEEDSGF
jgi:DnaK suppressor protein